MSVNNRYAIVGWPLWYRLSIKLYCEKIEWLLRLFKRKRAIATGLIIKFLSFSLYITIPEKTIEEKFFCLTMLKQNDVIEDSL